MASQVPVDWKGGLFSRLPFGLRKDPPFISRSNSKSGDCSSLLLLYHTLMPVLPLFLSTRLTLPCPFKIMQPLVSVPCLTSDAKLSDPRLGILGSCVGNDKQTPAQTAPPLIYYKEKEKRIPGFYTGQDIYLSCSMHASGFSDCLSVASLSDKLVQVAGRGPPQVSLRVSLRASHSVGGTQTHGSITHTAHLGPGFRCCM